MTWIAVNGINTDGERNVNRLLYEMEKRGHDVCDFCNPRRNWITGRMRGRQFDDAWKLCRESHNGDSVIAHSRGGLVVFRAMQSGRRFRDVWLFSPAVPRRFRFPLGGADRVFVVFNPLDRAIFLTRFLLWGDFGTMGSEGSDWLANNPDLGRNIPHPRYGNGNSHSVYFLPDEVPMWADALEQRGDVEVGHC